MPKKLPENIERAVQTIRKEYGYYVQAKLMRNRYRLFEATSIYDPETKKPRKVTRYLGWLTEEGQLIPARHNDIKTKVFNEIDKSNAQKIKELEESLKNAEKKNYEEGTRKKETKKHEREILMALSMNARITVPELSKITGLSNTTVNYHLRNLERRYDIKYLLEIDVEKFGYTNYVAFVKFKDKKPSYEEIKQQLESIPYVQAAMATKGMYDVVIFMTIEVTSNARITLYNIRKNSFAVYETEWNIALIYTTFGFIPLRDQFFDALKEKIWKRTKEKPRPAHDEITEIEYKVLRTMNSNAAADFVSVDNKINVDKGRSNYAYHQLTKKGIIQRSTISISMPYTYDVIFLTRTVLYKEFSNARDKLLLDIISEKEHIDTYSLTCDITSPAGVLMISSMSMEEIGIKEEQLQNSIKGMTIEAIIITGMPIGSLDHRLFDKKETKQFELLVSEYNINQEKVLNEINYKPE